MAKQETNNHQDSVNCSVYEDLDGNAFTTFSCVDIDKSAAIKLPIYVTASNRRSVAQWMSLLTASLG